MLKLSTDTKTTLIALARKNCQSYLELHQQLSASYSEVSIDDYSVGTGVEIDEGEADARLENHFTLAKAQVRDFIIPLAALETSDKQTLYSWAKRHIFNFCVAPNQEKITKLSSELSLALDIMSPPNKLAPTSPPVRHMSSKSMFQPEKKRKHACEEESPQYNPQTTPSAIHIAN
ncbi:MAG: hypothetical protein P1U36_00770 [Legionellaceae bacterium]|nr:hypothetical protein [Legionellaceae bacterium]